MKKNLLVILLILYTIFYDNDCLAQATSLHEDFSTCISNLPTGWTKYSVTGTDAWNCTTSGHVGRGVQMSGYSNSQNNLNEDWLISPALNFATAISPTLEFWSRTKYTGPFIQVYVSNNYTTGNPNSASWTQLSVILPTANSDTWFLSSGMDLTPFKNQVLHIAFKYTSTNAAASTWKLDDVNVTDGTLTLTKKFINVGQVGAGNPSTVSGFSFTMSSIIGNLILDIPAPFEMSKNGTSFTNTLSYDNTASGIPQTVYIRIHPTVANKVYRKNLTFTYNSLAMTEVVQLLGTSLPDDKTLRVYNWNMRWFGDPSFCNCDTALAKLNATQILKDINADIYCLQEVVKVSQIAEIAAALGPQFSYVVSPFCSGVTTPASSFYASCQKLAYIYNTAKIENLGTFGLLASTYPADTSGYYCFSSGRFPFMLKAKLKLGNGLSDTIIFTNIHAKASSTIDDYNRRVCSTQKMTDSINALFPSKKIVIIGDYNDYIVGSAVAGQTISPYQYALNNGFTGITLPSVFVGQTTYVGSTNHIIDNVICSSPLYSSYVDSSCFIFNEPETYINDYVNTTSDHLPVMSYYHFQFPNALTTMVKSDDNQLFTVVNPSQKGLLDIYTNSILNEKYNISIYDMLGKKVFQKDIFFNMTHYSNNEMSLSSGMYWIKIEGNGYNQIQKMMIE